MVLYLRKKSISYFRIRNNERLCLKVIGKTKIRSGADSYTDVKHEI